MPIVPAAKIVVIDDDPRDLQRLVDALHRCSVSCRPFLYPQDINEFSADPHVRIIFVDLNLTSNVVPDDHTANFDAIESLITRNIKPSGPYFVALWTSHTGHGDALMEHLDRGHGGVPRPETVVTLDKTEHTREGASSDALIRSIDDIFRGAPDVAVLLAWEAHVMDAASQTVAEVGRLAALDDDDMRESLGLPGLLGHLAVAAVGRSHVERNRFRAIAQALVPVLSDRVASSSIDGRRGTDVRELCDAAIREGDLDVKLHANLSARLNTSSLLATSDVGSATDRGSVLRLSDVLEDDTFSDLFGADEFDTALQEFGRKDNASDSGCRWVLVQARAACDHAQGRSGPLPFYLGLELPADLVRSKKLPDACWKGLEVWLDEGIRLLRVNARFGVFLTEHDLSNVEPRYRLREPLLADILYHIHRYGARPGMIAFRGK